MAPRALRSAIPYTLTYRITVPTDEAAVEMHRDVWAKLKALGYVSKPGDAAWCLAGDYPPAAAAMPWPSVPGPA